MRKRFSALSRLKKVAVVLFGLITLCCSCTLLLPTPDNVTTEDAPFLAPTVSDSLEGAPANTPTDHPPEAVTNTPKAEPTTISTTTKTAVEPVKTEIASTKAPAENTSEPVATLTLPASTEQPTEEVVTPIETKIEATATILIPTATTVVTQQPTSTPFSPTETPLPPPTATQVIPAECQSDNRNCSNFDSQPQAQSFMLYCMPFNDDIHNLDGDADGIACEDDDPQFEPFLIQATSTPAIPWECQADRFNCSDFNSQWEAQQTLNMCRQYNGDIHGLDQNNNGSACEDDPRFAPPPTAAPATASPASTSCDCSWNAYNCKDFATQNQAQACFNSCMSAGFGDIHDLDGNNDGEVCVSLP